MLKLENLGEMSLLVCPTFEVVPIGFKPSASPRASKPPTHSRKAHRLVVKEYMFYMSVVRSYKLKENNMKSTITRSLTCIKELNITTSGVGQRLFIDVCKRCG